MAGCARRRRGQDIRQVDHPAVALDGSFAGGVSHRNMSNSADNGNRLRTIARGFDASGNVGRRLHYAPDGTFQEQDAFVRLI